MACYICEKCGEQLLREEVDRVQTICHWCQVDMIEKDKKADESERELFGRKPKAKRGKK